jgi:hypothetical protein
VVGSGSSRQMPLSAPMERAVVARKGLRVHRRRVYICMSNRICICNPTCDPGGGARCLPWAALAVAVAALDSLGSLRSSHSLGSLGSLGQFVR